MVYYSIKTLDDLLSEGGQTLSKSSFARSNSSVGTQERVFLGPGGLKIRGRGQARPERPRGGGVLGDGAASPLPISYGV